MAAPSLCSSTTVTTVFQQPIMSPAMAPLCLDPLSLPMAKRPQDVEEVRFFAIHTKVYYFKDQIKYCMLTRLLCL